MFRMRRMFELLLQMNKRAGGLNQPFEILRVVRRDRLPEPDLLENIVRFIVTLLVPALEKGAVIRMIGHRVRRRLRFAATQFLTNREILSPLLMESLIWWRLR